MQLAFYIASGILLIFGILAWLNIQKWYIKIFDVGKFHFCILILALIIIWGIFIREYTLVNILLLSALLLVFAINFAVVLPFMPLWKKELLNADSSSEAETISLLICNVRQKNCHTDKLKSIIQKVKPDVVLLTEVDDYWCSEIEKVVDYLPHRVLQPQDNTYGMVLYSRLELKDAQVNFYIEDEIPSIRCKMRIDENTYINFFGLHPRPPAPWTKLVNKQAEILLVSKIIGQLEEPTIVAGDLNDVGWSKITSEFKKISGLVDPRIGRGFYNTYNAEIPLFRYPIDHLFVSDCFKLIKLDRMGYVGSDHFPMYVEVNYDANQIKKANQQKISSSATVFAKKAEYKQP